VLAFHKQEAGQGGLRITSDTAIGRGGHTFVATGGKGANVSVTVLRTSNGTFVQMSYR
jgi:hypothetical protein